ncbi:MAG: alpha/beta hydrolase [Alphaproteobacteria bacterium]|nr:alpha/beta hydrolase [Alphaproteobacteria bacterium]
MSEFSDVTRAIERNDLDEAASRLLRFLANPGFGSDRLSDAEIIDFTFEVGDWLFEAGRPELGAQVYAAAFGKLQAAGSAPSFELARRLDRLSDHLSAAERYLAALRAAEGSLELTRADTELDGRGVVWRLNRVARLNETLGDVEAAKKARDEAQRVKMQAGLGGLKDDLKPKMSMSRPKTSKPKMSGAPIEPTPPQSGPARPLAGDADAGEPAASDDFEMEWSAAGPNVEERYRSLADQLSEVPDSDAYHKVPVHFATHRMPIGDVEAEDYDPYNRFGFEPSRELRYGRALVTVPADRALGSYVEPSGGFFGNGGALEKSFTVQSVEILADGPRLIREVAGLISESGENDKGKELLVFLHGYRTTLASGLMRAAQLKVDMMIEGAVVLYSLPSKGTWSGYPHDRDAAADPLATEQLRDFLIALSEETGAERMHLVAHSLGSEMLMRSLNEIYKREEPSPKRRFDEIIFAAPDVDHDDFVAIVPRFTKLGGRVTVYASQRDIPLMAISWIVDRSRAGFDAARLAGIPGVDSIDTTASGSWLGSLWGSWGHWDFVSEAVDDFRAVVWLSLLPPGRRSLLSARQRTDQSAFWAVEIKQGAGILRTALEWARSLKLEAALGTARNAAEAEASRTPPGDKLEFFQQVTAELEVFEQNIRSEVS